MRDHSFKIVSVSWKWYYLLFIKKRKVSLFLKLYGNAHKAWFGLKIAIIYAKMSWPFNYRSKNECLIFWRLLFPWGVIYKDENILQYKMKLVLFQRWKRLGRLRIVPLSWILTANIWPRESRLGRITNTGTFIMILSFLHKGSTDVTSPQTGSMMQ